MRGLKSGRNSLESAPEYRESRLEIKEYLPAPYGEISLCSGDDLPSPFHPTVSHCLGARTRTDRIVQGRTVQERLASSGPRVQVVIPFSDRDSPRMDARGHRVVAATAGPSTLEANCQMIPRPSMCFLLRPCWALVLALVLLFDASTIKAQPPDRERVYHDPDSLVRALYAAVSFDRGTTPDWAYVRSLFHKDASIVLRVAKDSTAIMSVDGFVDDFVDFINRFPRRYDRFS